jgi:integrase/recombinase XerC
MQQIPTPQLIRIPTAPLVPLAPGPEKSNDIWEQFLRVQIKPTTQQTYRRAILRFCQENASGQSPSHFLSEFLALPQRDAIQIVLEWRQSQIDAGLASATINQRLAAIRSLVDFANRAEICSYSLRAVKSLRNQSYKDTRGVSVDDFKAIIDLVDRSTDLGIRDYAILRILWDLALRRAAVCSLDLEHYSATTGQLFILNKGEIDLTPMDLGTGLREALDNWVAIRRGLYFQPKNGVPDPALFLSCNGRRLNGVAIWRIVTGYAEAADLKLSPHGTRHSAITAFLDASGGDVRSAQSLSRHKDPRTLMIYDDNRQGLQGKASQALGDLLDLSEPEC